MQVQWRRLFAIVFGVLIWAATVALLEVCVFTFWFWKAWGFSGGNDAAGVVALGFCLIALPLTTALPSQLHCSRGESADPLTACAKVLTAAPVNR
jgi:hypothetical protein